jgi:F-type H+-transporting ATPase subunit b
MTIDWFTVSAQTLNFLLLVWLLKRYLYGPILKAIDARENQIAKVMSDADTIKSDVESQRNLLEQKNAEIDTNRDELLKVATKTANDQSEQIVFQAHKKADEISNTRFLALDKELQHYQNNIALKTLQEVYEIARKVLADLADVELEQKMFECFCKHLKNLSPDEKTNLNKTLKADNTEMVLYSAFELTQAQIEAIDNILIKLTSANTDRQYQLKQEVKVALISGIELRSNAWEISWNSEDYLKVLQTFINQLLTEQRETLNDRTAQLNSRMPTTKDSA